MRKIYSALDIGSSYIKLVVGEFINNRLNILCALKKETRGFKNNQITNSDTLIKSINCILNEASLKLNFKITKLIVNIPTDYNDFLMSDGMIKLENEVVSTNDIIKVMQECTLNRIKANDELIASLPIIFNVGDNETNSPFGKRGKTISVKSVLVSTDKKKVYDLVKLLEKCDIQVIDITTTGLVDYYNFKCREFDGVNMVVVNIGYTTTNISVFSKGIYINNICLEVGASAIDAQTAKHFNIRKKDAIFLRETYGRLVNDNLKDEDDVLITDLDGKEIRINRYELCKFISKQLHDIIKLIKKNINDLTKKEISYIIITGGLAEFKDLGILLDQEFDNVKLGNIEEIGARDNSFSVSIGDLKYFNEKLSLRGKDFGMLSDEDIELLTNGNSKLESGESLLGKVFSYFFDN